MCCVVVCDLETTRIGAPYIYDISRLRVNVTLTRAAREPAQNNGCGPWPGKSLNSPVVISLQ